MAWTADAIITPITTDLSGLHTGFNQAKGAAQQLSGSMTGTFRNAAKDMFAPIMAGAAAAAGAFLSIRSAVNRVSAAMKDIDQTAKFADRIGVTTEALVGLRHAAELSGVSAGQLDMAMQRMTRRLAEAAVGGGEAVGALQSLGLSARELSALSPDQQIMAIADAMEGVTNQSERVRLAFKLFDSEGVALVNTLKGGSAAIRGAMEETQRLQTAFTRFEAAKVEEANDAMTRLWASVRGAGKSIAIDLAPHIERTATSLSKVIPQSVEWVARNKELIAGIATASIAVPAATAALTAMHAAVAAAGGAMAAFRAIAISTGIAIKTAFPMVAATAAIAAFTAVVIRSRMENEKWAESAYQVTRQLGMFQGPVQQLGELSEAAGRVSTELQSAAAATQAAAATAGLGDDVEARREELRLMEEQMSILMDQIRMRDKIIAEAPAQMKVDSPEFAIFQERQRNPDWDRAELRKVTERYDGIKKTIDAMERTRAKQQARSIVEDMNRELGQALQAAQPQGGGVGGWMMGAFSDGMRQQVDHFAKQAEMIKGFARDLEMTAFSGELGSLFEGSLNPLESQAAAIEHLNEALQAGRIDLEQYGEGLKQIGQFTGNLQDNLANEIERFREGLKSPLDGLAEQLDRIDAWRAEGLIDDAEWQKGRDILGEQLKGMAPRTPRDVDMGPQLAGFIRAGSQEAYRLQAQIQAGAGRDQIPREQLRVAERQERLLEELVRKFNLEVA